MRLLLMFIGIAISMEEEKEIEIDLGKKYLLPDFSVQAYKGNYIVIFPLIAKWLILHNEEQLDFFNLLGSHTIQQAINLSIAANQDIEWVLIQLEGKKICNTEPFEKSIDRSLHLYITNACNLHCPHCYMNAGMCNENELSTDLIVNIIECFASEGGRKIILSGGEVLMRSDFIHIVKECSRLDLIIEILTNGTLWNKQIIKEIAQDIHKIQISIDGFNEEENAKVRGKGSFLKAIDAIRQISEYNIPIEIAVTPHYDQNLKEKISQYAEFGKQLLTEFPKTIMAVKFTGEIFDGRDIKFSKEEKNEYLQIAQEIYRQCYNRSGDEAFIEYHKKGGKEGNCNYGNLAIDAEGNIYFCPAVNLMHPFGNVRNVNLRKLFQNVGRIQHKSHVDNIEPCNICDLRYICGGECRAIHFKLFSDCNQTFHSRQNGKRMCSPMIKNHYYDMLIRTNNLTLE